MKAALLFPGQGSQFAGMGQALAEAFPESREVFERADAALGIPLAQMCFEGPDDTLALTENTQPAILTVSIAAWRALAARGVTAIAAAGHSLGEYSAHVAAGTLSFDDAVRTVRARGQFMQAAVPVGAGAMAAIIGLDEERIQALCVACSEGDEVAEPANFNSPEQTVIAGAAAAVDRLVDAAQSAGAKRAIRLAVSAPFHSSLMQPAAERLAPLLAELTFRDADIPVYTNVDTTPVQAGDAARTALVRQVAAPVRWHPLIRRMIDDGFDTFVEVGPGRVLAGLMRRIDRSVKVFAASDGETIERTVTALGEAQ